MESIWTRKYSIIWDALEVNFENGVNLLEKEQGDSPVQI